MTESNVKALWSCKNPSYRTKIEFSIFNFENAWENLGRNSVNKMRKSLKNDHAYACGSLSHRGGVQGNYGSCRESQCPAVISLAT
jgi:hypothetical protein